MIKVEEEILTIYGFKITASKHTTEIELKQDLRNMVEPEAGLYIFEQVTGAKI